MNSSRLPAAPDIPQANARILIVDDERLQRESLAEYLDEEYLHIDIAANGEEAMKKIKSSATAYEIVITDLKMTGITGHQLLRWVKKRYPTTEVIIITAFATVDNAVQAIKDGAADYITKPIDTNRLRLMIRKTLERQQLLMENLALKKHLRDRDTILGTSDAMQGIMGTVERVANTDATVLIEGASGTGKEVVARAIHNQSPRKKKPFIVVNCAALPTTLLENELFGHEKEAFTGATSLRKGRFEQANGGTIFLDEITEMSLESQSGFLRVLEDGCFHRVGGSELIEVDVRIIAASNRIVKEQCEKGLFRYDLYYRLNVVPINLPSLKDRSEDIPLLAQTFLREFALKYNRLNIRLADELVKRLTEYEWPGNVRELKNTLERAVILSATDTISPEMLPGSLQQAANQMDVPMNIGISLREMEEIMIRRTLESVDGHRRKAAAILGISVRTLQYKIKEYSISI